MRVYIAGKITGNKNYMKQFKDAEELLTVFGYDVFNPAAHHVPGYSWAQYMRRDIAELVKCDKVFFMRNWVFSMGAWVEMLLCKFLGIDTCVFKV
jgi:hypothetical protein